MKTVKFPPEYYELIAEVCVETLMECPPNKAFVRINLPEGYKFPRGFPKPMKIKKEYKAKELLAWLNEKGYTTITYEQIRDARRSLSMTARVVENKLFAFYKE